MKFRCDPCGSGTRCISCIWLVAFCHGFKDDIKNDTFFTFPFKQPYIEMYENLRDGIILGDFTDQEVESFLGATHSAIARDCLFCKDVPILNRIRKHVQSGVKKLKRKNKNNYKPNKSSQTSLEMVNKTLNYFKKLPENLVGIVDEASLDALTSR